MCEPIETRSISELNSDSSWSVIEESGSSRNSSLENILENVIVEENKGNSSENHESDFIDIPKTIIENIDTTMESGKSSQAEVNHTESGKSKVHKTKQKKRKPKRSKTESLSWFAIAASVSTIIGITLLCVLFPLENTPKYDYVSRNQMNLKANNPVKTIINTDYSLPSYNYSKYQTTNLITEMNDVGKNQSDGYESDEGICPTEENEEFESNSDFNNFFNNIHEMKPSFDDFLNDIANIENESTSLIDMDSFKKLSNKIIGGLKDALSNGSLHVLICAFMQDICLIKLLKQISKQNTTNTQNKKSPRKPNLNRYKRKTSSLLTKAYEKKFTRKLDQIIRKKLADLEIIGQKKENKTTIPLTTPCSILKCSDSHIIQTINKRYNNDSGSNNQKKENGKSECQRRFEDLDNEWETLGENHRQKIQEIKEKFKNEIHFVKESESEGSQRKQRIKLIREKYIQRLKSDREKYLLQLKTLKDERHRILTDICHRKKLILDSKDAAVGNYPVLLPDSYNFEQKLHLLKLKEDSNLGNIRLNLNLPSAINSSTGPVFPSIHHIRKNDSDDCIWQQKLLETNYRRYCQYPDISHKIMKKRRKLLKLQKNKTFPIPNIMDIATKMPESIPKQQSNDSKLNVDSQINETARDTTELGELVPLAEENSTLNFGFLLKNEQSPLQDIYEIAFGNNARKIKQAEFAKRSLENTQTRQAIQMPILSKQDPKKSHKKKMLFKGLM